MTKLNYAQQMKHPMWQKKRLEVLELNGFSCESCGSKDYELHVHHPFYRKGAMIWQYEAEELQCLCHVCHKEEHALDEKIKKAVSVLSISNKHKALGYLETLEGNTILNPDTYEYCMGVGDAMSYCEYPILIRSKRYDNIQKIILENKGCTGAYYMDNGGPDKLMEVQVAVV